VGPKGLGTKKGLNKSFAISPKKGSPDQQIQQHIAQTNGSKKISSQMAQIENGFRRLGNNGTKDLKKVDGLLLLMMLIG
jgi:hypothetical protein